jgi:hypothetical protein
MRPAGSGCGAAERSADNVRMKCRDRSGGDRSSRDCSRLTVVEAAALTLFAMNSSCSGCLWIAIPSLAYQGYKYESGDQNGQAKQHQSSQPPASDDVE